MPALRGFFMPGGRPKKGQTKKTNHVRVKPDIAEMVSWICLATGEKAAELLDPLLRTAIVLKHRENEKLINSLKKKRAEEEAKKAESAGQE